MESIATTWRNTMNQTRNRSAGVEDRWADLKKPRQNRDIDGSPTFDMAGQPVMTNVPVSRGKGLRWRAGYVDEDGREHARGFATKAAATARLNGVVAAQETGSYVDPARGKVTFASFWADWSSRQVWESSTHHVMAQAARSVTFGDVALAELRPSHLKAWVKSMQDAELQPSIIRTRFANVRTALRAALRDRFLPRDITTGIKLPRVRKLSASMTIPAAGEVRAVLVATETSAPWFTAFVAVCAFAGLRRGEACALRVSDVDFLRREPPVAGR